MLNYRLGLVSVSFRDRTPKEIAEAMRSAGLSFIEWGSDVHAPCLDKERLNEIAALQREYGIECSSYGTYFRLGETSLDELENYIDAALLLGTDILRVWCGTKRGADMSAEERESLVAECINAAAIAEARGVTLCTECHKKTFTEDPEDTVYLLERVNSAHFKTYWQPFQWQCAEENALNAQRLAPYATHVHVFNWRDDESGVLRKYPLADAADAWRAYLAHFSTPRTLLLEFMPNGTLGELAEEAGALKSIVGEE